MKYLRRIVLAALVGFILSQLPTPEQLVTRAAAQAHGPAVTVPLSKRPPDRQPLVRVAVLGDVGTGDENEWHTARLVEEAGSHDPFDALVLLGDNAYPDGNPERLDDTVFEPFGGVLAGDADLVPVLGNHDVQAGHGDAQAAALGMPGRWYARDLGDLMLVALDSNRPFDPDQQAWLEQTLDAADEPWIVVALHHPPFSAGAHGSDLDVRSAFVALFERHGVDLVLAGHEHDYQRSHPINGVTYLVSGGAAKLRPTGAAEFTAASFSTFHFVELAAYTDRLEVRAINDDGVFDSAVVSGEVPAVAGVTEVEPPVGSPAIVVGLLGLIIANGALLLAPVAVVRVASRRLGQLGSLSLAVLVVGIGYSLLAGL